MRYALLLSVLSVACEAGTAPDDAPARPDVPMPASDAGIDAPASDAPADAGPPASFSAGCFDGAGLPEGESTFELEGLTRRYVVRLPNGYTNARAWPLVLALHGNGGSITEWDRESGNQNIRAVLEDEAILIVTEAIDGNWRDYDMPESTWAARMETELAYFDHILTAAGDALCIDRSAIFSMGFSGGGSFSGVLACRRTDIRAIAVGGAVIYFDPADCVGTPAAWITIGDMESNAGRTDYRDFWRDRAGCEASSMPTGPDGCIAYDGCEPETPVTFCAHPAGHVWPSFGSEAMWAFFSSFWRG